MRLFLMRAPRALTGMVFAERTSTLREEALSFQVLFAAGAVETLAVVVVVQRLDPLIAGLDRETAGEALGREQIVPVLLAVRIALLEEERAVAELLAAVRALEALRMELLANGIQAIALNSAIALRAQRGQEFLEAVLAVQVTLLLDESDVGQRTLAVGVVADEVIRAPDASQCGDEWSSDLLVAASTQRYTATRSDGLVHHTTSTVRCRRGASGPSLVERVRTLWRWRRSRSERRSEDWSCGRSWGRCGNRSRGWSLNRSRSLTGESGREGRRYTAGHRRVRCRGLHLSQRAHRERSTERLRRNVVLVDIIAVRRLRATVQIGVCVESSRDGLYASLVALLSSIFLVHNLTAPRHKSVKSFSLKLFQFLNH
uniref:Putative secreted protein n=1 Tax=Anopheles aquasalis TaxID=42839 RepID=T1DPJ7_ANOAQ